MNRFGEYRNLLGFTLEEVAEKTTIPVDRLNKIEKGSQVPDLADALLMHYTYNVSVDYLLGNLRINVPAKTLADIDFLVALNEVSEEQLQELLKELCTSLYASYSDAEIGDMLLQLENEGKIN